MWTNPPKNPGKGQTPPPFMAMPGFWVHLHMYPQPLPNFACCIIFFFVFFLSHLWTDFKSCFQLRDSATQLFYGNYVESALLIMKMTFPDTDIPGSSTLCIIPINSVSPIPPLSALRHCFPSFGRAHCPVNLFSMLTTTRILRSVICLK